MNINLSTLIDRASIGPDVARSILKKLGHDISCNNFPHTLLSTIGEPASPSYSQGAKNHLSIADLVGISGGLDLRMMVRASSKVRAFSQFLKNNAVALAVDESFFVCMGRGDKMPYLSKDVLSTDGMCIVLCPGYVKKVMDVIFEYEGYER